MGDRWLLSTGRLAGVAGVLLSVLAGIARMSGRFLLGRVEVGTVLTAGIAAMVFACLCFLVVLTNQARLGR